MVLMAWELIGVRDIFAWESAIKLAPAHRTSSLDYQSNLSLARAMAMKSSSNSHILIELYSHHIHALFFLYIKKLPNAVNNKKLPYFALYKNLLLVYVGHLNC